MARNSSPLTDDDWYRIKAVLPRSRGGRPRTNDRAFVDALLFALGAGAPLAEVGAIYGIPGASLETRLRRWRLDGTLEKIFAAIGFKPLAPHERHLREGMGTYQRMAMRERGFSRWR